MSSSDLDVAFAPFVARMQAAGVPSLAIATFKAHYAALCSGETGEIPESAIEPVTELPNAEALPDAYAEVGREALDQTVFVKLNGGLGTSMGLRRAKSLLPVRGDRTFLDLIAAQASHAGCPLLLMNSFATRDDTTAALARWPALLDGALPIDFLQHRVPKVDQRELAPVDHEPASATWCPPGHGDLYTALVTRGVLEQLLAAGRRYLFVSNSDNLGAVLDLRILGWFVAQSVPFLMEVADRTEADRKGGHLARRAGQLILREVAQCPASDLETFQDHTRHRYFNTNNLWIDLHALAARMGPDRPLVLPLIRNRKTVDPRDPTSTPVYQLESAMGAAIGVFPGAQAIRVPRTRLVPVKTTGDLLRTRSDATVLLDDGRLVPATERPPNVVLDKAHYKLVGQLDDHFPEGPPSLKDCTSFVVEGDVVFGGGVICRGDVRVTAPQGQTRHVASGAILSGTVEL
ncbi:MAG: UTP--glucose-1-phosphate uridylyltransferase [Deltaproteobacteria bacterium]|nr:UTP--glucose-1-phosphate uridylyltransferase [Deltaproteobacteria bacterium]HCH61889.1 UTP--glucose-1-phosphate uridylyltransferase [Deltaproteobacteria bacterium]